MNHNYIMSLDKSQIVPFPLPEHLCIFISEKLNSPIETISNGVKAKALHIHRKQKLGVLILRALEKTSRPVKVSQGFSMYISVSKYNSTNDKNIVESRGSFLEIPQDAISDIIDIFEDLFRMCLVSFIDGSNFGAAYKKGHRKYALTTFLEKYNLAGNDLMFEKYKKHYHRTQKRGKTLIFN